MERPTVPPSTLADLETAAKQDQVIVHVQDGEFTQPRVLLASRATLVAQSSVLAARLAEAGPDQVRLPVTAAPATFERLYTMMQAVAVTGGGRVPLTGAHGRTPTLITSADLTTTLPLAVRFGAAGVVACLVAGVQLAPTIAGVVAVDKWVPDDGVLGGFKWGRPVEDLLIKECLSCTWARSDNRTYFKIEDDNGDVLYRQRIKAHGPLTMPRPHHTFNWYGWGSGPRRARTLQVLLDRVWLSQDTCGLTHE